MLGIPASGVCAAFDGCSEIIDTDNFNSALLAVVAAACDSAVVEAAAAASTSDTPIRECSGDRPKFRLSVELLLQLLPPPFMLVKMLALVTLLLLLLPARPPVGERFSACAVGRGNVADDAAPAPARC